MGTTQSKRDTHDGNTGKKSSSAPPKKGWLKNVFAKACRKCLTAVFVGAGLLLGGKTQGQILPKKKTLPEIRMPDTPRIDTTQKPANKSVFSGYAPLTTAQKDSLNNALVEKLRQKFPDILNLANINYSERLGDLEVELTTALQKLTDDERKKIVVIDAHTLDVGLALGLNRMQAVQNLLKQENIPLAQKQLMAVFWNALIEYTTKYGDFVHTQGPFCLSAMPHENNMPTILLPASDNTTLITIDGLPFYKTVQFVNMHEAWHALDNRINYDGIIEDNLSGVSLENPKTYVDNTDAQILFSRRYKKEVSADVAACGQMIRSGGTGLEIIDLVSKARAQAGYDLFHMSPMVLQGLKTEINKIGLDAFKAMSEEESRDFYYRVTHQYGMSALSFHYYAAMEMATAEEMSRFRGMADISPDIKKALTVFDQTRDKSQHKQLMDLENPEAKKALEAYDPKAELIARAHKIGYYITPETVIKAYGRLMNELAKEREKDPSKDDLITHKMSRLKMAFVKNLTTIDYVSVNIAHGITHERLANHGGIHFRDIMMPGTAPLSDSLKFIGRRYF